MVEIYADDIEHILESNQITDEEIERIACEYVGLPKTSLIGNLKVAKAKAYSGFGKYLKSKLCQ